MQDKRGFCTTISPAGTEVTDCSLKCLLGRTLIDFVYGKKKISMYSVTYLLIVHARCFRGNEWKFMGIVQF